MNRRGFLWAVGATGLGLWWPGLGGLLGRSEKRAERLLRKALTGRNIVNFRYHGHPRRVEPHALGRLAGGRLALLAWQVAGGSASEPPPGWRTFLLTDMGSLTLSQEQFTPRPDYHPEKTRLEPIEAEVAP